MFDTYLTCVAEHSKLGGIVVKRIHLADTRTFQEELGCHNTEGLLEPWPHPEDQKGASWSKKYDQFHGERFYIPDIKKFQLLAVVDRGLFYAGGRDLVNEEFMAFINDSCNSKCHWWLTYEY